MLQYDWPFHWHLSLVHRVLRHPSKIVGWHDHNLDSMQHMDLAFGRLHHRSQLGSHYKYLNHDLVLILDLNF